MYEDLEITDPTEFRKELEGTKDELIRLRDELVAKQKTLSLKEEQV